MGWDGSGLNTNMKSSPLLSATPTKESTTTRIIVTLKRRRSKIDMVIILEQAPITSSPHSKKNPPFDGRAK
ncbi:hypothetical protein LINPERHAP2_LOCUS21184 [Linum perenne]